MWLYDEDGKRTIKAGKPRPRPPGMPTPCHSCPKIPAGVEKIPENARELDVKGWRTYSHYQQCRAVGQFPDDELVRRHAAIIRDEEDAYKDSLLIQTIGLIARAK